MDDAGMSAFETRWRSAVCTAWLDSRETEASAPTTSIPDSGPAASG